MGRKNGRRRERKREPFFDLCKILQDETRKNGTKAQHSGWRHGEDERYVSVTGPRGVLHRDFNHIAKIDLHHDKENNTIVAAMYFPTSKITSALRTTCSHISNMFDGVLYGYEYKMRAVYAHFP